MGLSLFMRAFKAEIYSVVKMNKKYLRFGRVYAILYLYFLKFPSYAMYMSV